MKVNQKGFGATRILIVVAVIIAMILLGVAAWLVYDLNGRQRLDNDKRSAAEAKSKTTFTDCHTTAGDITGALSNGTVAYKWITVEHTKVVLSDWDMTLTIPENMVGKAVCRYSHNGYEFSTKSVVNDDWCVIYYREDEVSSEALEIAKYPANTMAEGQIMGAAGTLDAYYTAHKAADGNYFTDTANGRNYYKIGDNFYVAFGDTTESLDKNKAARLTACKNEKPDFRQPFVDAMSSLKQD